MHHFLLLILDATGTPVPEQRHLVETQKPQQVRENLSCRSTFLRRERTKLTRASYGETAWGFHSCQQDFWNPFLFCGRFVRFWRFQHERIIGRNEHLPFHKEDRAQASCSGREQSYGDMVRDKSCTALLFEPADRPQVA